MKTIWNRILTLLFLSSIGQHGYTQGFVNLDFESANLSPVPSGQYGGFVPISNALPGWTGYINGSQVTNALQNNLTVGSSSIDILGPDWINNGAISIIEGNYTVLLQGGSPANYSAAIAQTGLIPVDARSLEFKSDTVSSLGQIAVTIGGQSISLTPLTTTSTYILYGGDISAFSGQTEELRFTAPGASALLFSIDSVVFSTSPVPEPSVLGLLALGGLFFGLRRWRHLRGEDYFGSSTTRKP